MVKNRKLAKQISDVAWGNFLTMLEYKGDIYGCEIHASERFFPSSKRCSNCGYIKEDLTLATREGECPKCKHFWDRDINAALNLMLLSESKIPLEEGKSTSDQLVVRLGMNRNTGSGQEATSSALASLVVLHLTNPKHNATNGDIFVGTVRTVFVFD